MGRRILVCLRYGIGDVVMELPVLEALRRAVPAARITALGAFPATQLLERHRCLDAVLDLGRWGIAHRWDRGPAGVGEAISAWLDEQRFDLFLDLHHAPPVFGEAVWSRGIRSLEADEKTESAAIQAGASGVEAIQAAVRAGWGLDGAGGRIPRLTPAAAARAFADGFLRRLGFGNARPLAVSPVASLALKRWPVERLASVADELIEDTGERILIFAGPQHAIAASLRRHMRHGERVVVVGALHLMRVAALLERCRAFVCNDTGLMHIAGAVGTATVAVFGPTAASVYGPPHARVVAVGGPAVDCPHVDARSLHPPPCCVRGRCLVGERGCIDRTTEADVRRALHELLGRAREPPAAGVAVG